MSFGSGTASATTLQDALEDASNALQEALTGKTKTSAASKPVVELDPDPAMAAFMASQQPPSLELDQWARLIQALEKSRNDGEVKEQMQDAGARPDSVTTSAQELMQIFQVERAKYP